MNAADPLQSHAPLARGGIDLRGAGQVGGTLLRLLDAAAIPVSAVHRRSGVERRGSAPASVLVDATPPSFEGPAAEEWVSFLEATLRGGTPVVTCNKAPLATAWARLAKAAAEGGVALAATATVGGGTPVLPALRRARLRGGSDDALDSVEATLSGTLGVVLPRVKAGASLAQAVAEAQAAGLCEPDASLDLDGTDAWAKACIVHNSVWPEARPIGLPDRANPLRLDEAAIRLLARPAVVARIAPGRVTLALEDWRPPASSGLYVRARTRQGRTVEVAGAGAGPANTAHALLADVQAVLAGRLAAGIH